MPPRSDLLHAYGTEDVLREKTAGELPLVARLSAALLSAGLGHAVVKSQGEQRDEAERMNLAAEELEERRISPATSALRHSRAPALIGPGFIDPAMVPVGLDEGMVRLAEATGRALAKVAGIGSLAVQAGTALGKMMPGLKGQAALGAGTLGAAYLGTKAVKGGLNTLGRESGPRNFGAGNNQVPFGVNEYGQPQSGTPLL